MQSVIKIGIQNLENSCQMVNYQNTIQTKLVVMILVRENEEIYAFKNGSKQITLTPPFPKEEVKQHSMFMISKL
jgi:hypothetical protein